MHKKCATEKERAAVRFMQRIFVKKYFLLAVESVCRVKQFTFPPRRPGFESESCHARFVGDKEAMGQVFSKYFCYPCQSSFTNCSPVTFIYHLVLVQVQ
jgi:hypothetical protein